MSVSDVAAPAPEPLGLALERIRLAHRRERIERVLAALHERERYHSGAGGAVPVPLRQAIHGFELELGQVQRRLATLAAPAEPEAPARAA